MTRCVRFFGFLPQFQTEQYDSWPLEGGALCVLYSTRKTELENRWCVPPNTLS